jgi:hypothetical protein
MTAFLESEGDYDPKQARPANGGFVIAPPPVNTYRAEIEAFSQALLEGRDTSESARRGLRSQMILEACYRSAREKREIKIAAPKVGSPAPPKAAVNAPPFKRFARLEIHLGTAGQKR